MSRFILVPMMLAATLAVTVAGCNRFPDQSIQVTANLQPDVTNCGVTDDQDTFLATGVIDREAPPVFDDYYITPLVQSYIVSNALEFQGEQGNMQITSFEITIVLPDGTVPDLGEGVTNPYKVQTTAVIPPNQSAGSSSQRATFAVAIPASYYPAVLAIPDTTGFDSIALEIRANGTTSGGFSQTSPVFRWPINFCDGCLGVVCEAPAELGDPVGCFPGQDIWGYCAQIVVPAAFDP
jgi:hypothetical protein